VNPKLPVVTAKALVRVVEQLGFVFRRQSGSHAIYVRARDQARIVIPMHGGELKRKTLRGIIQDLRITVEEFREML
jgi:predicted RNA binding protein YcfA (HicA-like mRNA interferase family)